MKTEDFDDRFLKLAVLMAREGYTIVGYETNCTDISLTLREGGKPDTKPEEPEESK
jgi:hypothetical protein